jgi:hypothetical protein
MRRLLRHQGVAPSMFDFSSAAILTKQDLSLAERVLKFWAAMEASEASTGLVRDNDVWTDILSRQGTLMAILKALDPQGLAEYLRGAPGRSIFQGVLQGDAESRLLRRNGPYRRLQSALTVDRFLSLMEAIGAIAVQNPAQGQWGFDRVELDYVRLMTTLDAICGVEVVVPQIFDGVFVTTIGGRVFNGVDLMAIDSALRIRRVLRASSSTRILEIGAGSGRTAYWCLRLGLGPVQIIDLPHVALAQAWYFAKTLPDGDLHLFGEPPAPNARVSIFPDSALDQVANRNVGLVFNQDSFAEMSVSAFNRYSRWIEASDCEFLVSTNHESEAAYAIEARQLNPSRLLQTSHFFRLLDRQQNWIRRGYVDEIYAISHSV